MWSTGRSMNPTHVKIDTVSSDLSKISNQGTTKIDARHILGTSDTNRPWLGDRPELAECRKIQEKQKSVKRDYSDVWEAGSGGAEGKQWE